MKGHYSRSLLAWEVSSFLSQWAERRLLTVYYPALALRICINYLLLGNKSPQNIGTSNNNDHLLSHTVSVDWEFGSSLAGEFWTKVCLVIVVKMSVTSKTAHSYAQQVKTAFGSETSISWHVDLSVWLPKCSHNMVAGFPWASDPREIGVEATMVFVT